MIPTQLLGVGGEKKKKRENTYSHDKVNESCVHEIYENRKREMRACVL